jgi:hypothetical protein
MNPYLEAETLWPLFQQELVTCVYESLLPGLGDRYRAHIAKRRYPADAAAPAERINEEEYIEIRHRHDGRLVTLIDVVSPTNRTTDGGRRAYRDTRRAGRDAGANLVEIDLVLQGKPMLDYERAGLPEFDYAVTVKRSTQPERYEVYTTTLQERLPRFRLPLANDDRDTILDLQGVFSRAFTLGGFASNINYRSDPPYACARSADRLKHLLHQMPKNGEASGNGHSPAQEPRVTHETIAAVAYSIWHREGRPHGRDKEHWQKAVSQLQRHGR